MSFRNANRHNADKGAHFLMSTAMMVRKAEHKAQLANLHKRRKASKGTDKYLLGGMIDKMVIEYNRSQAPNYYDLHGMTVTGAQKFVADQVLRLETRSRYEKFRIETGMGWNTPSGVLTIKEKLQKKYGHHTVCTVKVDPQNSGIPPMTSLLLSAGAQLDIYKVPPSPDDVILAKAALLQRCSIGYFWPGC